jgi:hypothetical protein
VNRMTAKKFYSTEHLEKEIVNRKVDVNKNKINWMKVREVMIEKSKPFSIYMKEDLEQEGYYEIDIKKVKVGRPATFHFKDHIINMWPNGKEISAPKLKDIQDIMHLIPQDWQEFYQNLVGNQVIEDDVDGFTGNPDFEIESDL